jgi:hypothetical protein
MALTKITNSAIADDIGLGGNPTTSTQTAGNSTTRIATTAFVSTAVANLVDSAPETLNTLAELATSIGNNATLSSTLTTSIATKLPLAGGTMTGNLLVGTTSTSLYNDTSGGGINLFANGGLTLAKQATSVSDPVLLINNTGTAGQMIDLRQDGTTVGSIGTLNSGEDLYLNATDDLVLQAGGNTAIAAFQSSGSLQNVSVYTHLLPSGAHDLGSSGGKWRNLWLSGNIAVTGTVDGIDIAARDAVLTSTTTTAGAALPKAGGTMTGGLIVQAATGQLRLQGTSNTNKNVSIFYNESADYGQINVDESGVNQKDLWITGLNLKFGRNTTTERMRIDASGHVLIGKTSTAFGTAGISLRSEDVIQATRSAEPALEVNRLSTDGEIAGFYKDSARIGSIGVSSGSMYIEGNPATGKVGLTLFGSSIEPRDAGSASNGAVDLGATGSRFKDAHFSGTVNANTYAHDGDSDTYFNFPSANQLSLVGGGAEIVRAYQIAGAYGVLRVNGSGSATYPNFTFNGDDNTGMYRAGTDVLAFTTGGTNRMVIDSSGKVGIGISSPTQKLDVAGTALVENAKLKAIAESNTDTAVDVFVYDTRKDSDGGAWRKRTQYTSWYNETLNTSTRGARKEFPSVAVIVVASGDVIIYDGDDPDMTLWMEFSLPNHSPSSNWGSTSIGLGPADFQGAVASTAKMLNGQLIIGCASGTGLGGYLVNFISELMIDMVQYGTATDQFYHKVGNISQRDVTTLVTVPVRYSYSQVSPKISGRLINGAVNDVAMTVLPNAPIDPDTGLPVPTIAVATNGGISIIKDTGTVVDIISNSGSVYTPTSFVDIDDNYNLIFEQDSGGRSLMFIPIPSADRTTVANDGDRTDKRMLPTSSTGTGLNLIPRFNGSNASIAVSGKGDDQYIYGGEGVTSYAFGGTKLQSSVAYITSDYNTGHMVGDIKLATLSDTDATNVTGSELVTNGTFASNTTGWTAVNSSTLSYSSGKLRITNGASLNGAANTTITTVVGKTYVVSGEYTAGTSATGQLRVGTTTMGAQLAAGPFAAGIQTRTFVATGTTTHINFINSSVNGQYGEIDNISVRLAEEDRSVNGNGLQVFGTVTKTAVATGADLVSYGGFSRSNYLEQPYNSDLDFGTGDFSIMGWLQASSSNAGFRQTILDRGSASLDSIAITREYNGKFVCTAGSTVLTSTGTAYTSGNIHFALVRKSGTLAIYANGILDSAVSSTTNVTDTDAVMIIGVDRGLSASNWFTRDKLALLRISATAPTAEQIAKIYNDEKPLFQENAQATLYGTSNAVTALAYDDDTELLHVGTSAGRSVFQGLRRVDNTTDAVGAAISASNGLVAED